MKYTKKVSTGKWLKRGQDIKNGDVIEIASEGIDEQGEYGMQHIFLVKTATGDEGNVNFNQTSLNTMIDGYGDDSIRWIGKKAKTIVIPQIGKAPAYYFVHPDAKFDENTGMFSMKNETPEELNESVNPDSIPF